jgi:hypothetical protein
MLANRGSRSLRGCVIAFLWRAPLLAVLACATQQGTQVVPAQPLLGSQGAYSLLLMTAGWERIGADLTGDSPPDLILSHAGAGVTMVVRVHSQSEYSLDDIVMARRETLAESNQILSFEEERSFLDQSDFVPVSVARYRLRGGRAEGWSPVMVGTARGPASIVEIIAFGGSRAQQEGLFADMLSGLRIPAAPEKAP